MAALIRKAKFKARKESRKLNLSAVRSPAAPQLPPVNEAGVPGFDVSGWFAFFAPARTPREIITKVNADTVAALADPAIKGQLERIGYIASGSTPEELASLLASEIAKWGHLIKELGISVGD